MAQRTLNRRSRRDEVEDDQYDERDEAKDDEEEPPRRGRSRGRSRDEEEDDEPPRRGRRSSHQDPDEDEDEVPRGRRSRSSSARRGRDADDDERGSRPKATGKGWGGYKSKREETRSSDYVENYKLPDKQAELIKFLDAEPFSVYNEHWIEEARKKSWTCIGDDCPLCNIGDKAKTYALFNVIDMREGEDPKVVPLKASPMVADLLEEYARDKKSAPLNREDQYFSIQKKGGGQKGRVQVIINPVKARDLEEDWDIAPFTDAEIEQYEADMYEEDDVVQYPSRKTLKSVADELD